MPGYELIGKEEFREVQEVFDKGGILFRHGFDDLRDGCFKVKSFEKAFAEKNKVKYALAVTSGTAALRVALAALNIGEGDEVITQCFTFVATVEAIIESKATPICLNIDKTLNLDPSELEKSITPRTKAVIAVHMLGTPARIEKIREICNKKKIYLIEDTAWGCGGNLKNVPLGTWGDVGTFSFDFAKTITTGEGGMVIFKDKINYKKACAWHDHGHENNPLVPRWEDTRSSSGFNYRMMELQAAVGLAQLKKLSYIVDKQREQRDRIWENIKDIHGIEKRHSPNGTFDTADALVFFVKNEEIAKGFRNNLLEMGVSTKILPEAYTWHFAGTWNHMDKLNGNYKNISKNFFKKSEELLKRSVSIPININNDDNKADKVRISLLKTLNIEF